MFAHLFEPKEDLQIDLVGDTVHIVYNATLKPEFRIGPFTERYTGDWNVNLEDLSIELIDPDAESGTFGGMEFTLTYKPTVF